MKRQVKHDMEANELEVNACRLALHVVMWTATLKQPQQQSLNVDENIFYITKVPPQLRKNFLFIENFFELSKFNNLKENRKKIMTVKLKHIK